MINEQDKERKKFQELGIMEGEAFEVYGLRGYYKVDTVNRVVRAFDICISRNVYYGVIRGMYDNILNGLYKIKKKGGTGC